MSTIKITSLEQLKEWNNINKSKTDFIKPIVCEWFYDWFFEVLLDEKEDYKQAKDARDTMIEFTQICENKTLEEATLLTNANLRYYSNYACTRWPAKLDKVMELYKK